MPGAAGNGGSGRGARAGHRAARRHGRAHDDHPALHGVRRCRRAPRAATARVQKPHKTIAAAMAAVENGAVICVAEGTYAESLAPGEKSFTLAGGFQRGSGFKVRDSARYVTHARRATAAPSSASSIPARRADQLTAIDGFEITGYSQAIVRDFYYSQRFDITNNYIHDNACADDDAGRRRLRAEQCLRPIDGNVFRNNSCGRGGAGALNDTTNENTVVDRAQPDRGQCRHRAGQLARRRALPLRQHAHDHRQLFLRNTVTGWGGGLYVGAYTGGGQPTTATLAWNVYRGNSAGNAGGGFFCDDGATCISDHEIYDRNCGGNIFLDGGPGGSGPTVARFDHLTNVGARDVGCEEPGPGVRIDKDNPPPDTYSFINAIFWGNAPGKDFAASCDNRLQRAQDHRQPFDGATWRYGKTSGASIAFGDGIVAPVDPLFADPERRRLPSEIGRGPVDAGRLRQGRRDEPGLAKGDPARGATAGPRRARRLRQQRRGVAPCR